MFCFAPSWEAASEVFRELKSQGLSMVAVLQPGQPAADGELSASSGAAAAAGWAAAGSAGSAAASSAPGAAAVVADSAATAAAVAGPAVPPAAGPKKRGRKSKKEKEEEQRRKEAAEQQQLLMQQAVAEAQQQAVQRPVLLQPQASSSSSPSPYTWATFSSWGPGYIQSVLHSGIPAPWCHVSVPEGLRFGVELEAVVKEAIARSGRGATGSYMQSVQGRMLAMGATQWK